MPVARSVEGQFPDFHKKLIFRIFGIFLYGDISAIQWPIGTAKKLCIFVNSNRAKVVANGILGKANKAMSQFVIFLLN
jgi:hypothetical protein